MMVQSETNQIKNFFSPEASENEKAHSDPRISLDANRIQGTLVISNMPFWI